MTTAPTKSRNGPRLLRLFFYWNNMTKEDSQKIERWVIRIGAVIITGLASLVAWGIRQSVDNMANDSREMAIKIGSMELHIAEVRKELEIVKPKEVLAAIHQMDRVIVTKEDVRAIVSLNAPWIKDKAEYDRRLRELERRLDQLEAEICQP